MAIIIVFLRKDLHPTFPSFPELYLLEYLPRSRLSTPGSRGARYRQTSSCLFPQSIFQLLKVTFMESIPCWVQLSLSTDSTLTILGIGCVHVHITGKQKKLKKKKKCPIKSHAGRKERIWIKLVPSPALLPPHGLPILSQAYAKPGHPKENI